MLSFSGSLRIFIALDPCDMRAGINTLLALTGEKLREDPKSGSLFVFTNKRRRLLKVLYWDGTGYGVWGAMEPLVHLRVPATGKFVHLNGADALKFGIFPQWHRIPPSGEARPVGKGKKHDFSTT